MTDRKRGIAQALGETQDEIDDGSPAAAPVRGEPAAVLDHEALVQPGELALPGAVARVIDIEGGSLAAENGRLYRHVEPGPRALLGGAADLEELLARPGHGGQPAQLRAIGLREEVALVEDEDVRLLELPIEEVEHVLAEGKAPCRRASRGGGGSRRRRRRPIRRRSARGRPRRA